MSRKSWRPCAPPTAGGFPCSVYSMRGGPISQWKQNAPSLVPHFEYLPNLRPVPAPLPALRLFTPSTSFHNETTAYLLSFLLMVPGPACAGPPVVTAAKPIDPPRAGMGDPGLAGSSTATIGPVTAVVWTRNTPLLPHPSSFIYTPSFDTHWTTRVPLSSAIVPARLNPFFSTTPVDAWLSGSISATTSVAPAENAKFSS